MTMRLPILAHYTLTLLSTLYSCPITVAIVFTALWFFARTFPLRNKSRYSFKSAWVSKVSHLLGFVDLQLTIFLVITVGTLAELVAEPTFWKTLTVHLQTVNLCAFAPLVLLTGRKIHLGDCADYMLIMSSFTTLLDKLVKEVFIEVHTMGAILQLMLWEKAYRTWGGRRAPWLHF